MAASRDALGSPHASTASARGTTDDLATVAIFARAPVAGQVKTRLAGAVGAEGAARLASAFLRDTWSALAALPWLRAVVATTGPLGEAFADVEAWDQGDGDLGRRIERMLQRGLQEAPLALAIGADTPGLPSRLFDEARLVLASADAVIGPCSDGGFYLLGVRECPDGLLADLPWSQADTCACVETRLEERGYRVALLEPYFDVDRPEDLARLGQLIADGSVDAQATAAVIADLREAQANDGPRISVIIPTLNEAQRIGLRLTELAELGGPGGLLGPSGLPGSGAVAEVIVVDGGSSDDTVAIVRAFDSVGPSARAGPVAPVRVIESAPGRARQMNAGAAAATGDVLVFLHADVGLPADATRWIKETLADSRNVAGAFRTWTVADDRQSWVAPLLHFADLRSRYSKLPYGDQALFVRADVFRRAGGFADLPLMEDLELSRRLRRQGRIRTVPARVRVSGRRFVARPVFYTLVVNVLPLLFRLGVPAKTLVRVYGNPR